MKRFEMTEESSRLASTTSEVLSAVQGPQRKQNEEKIPRIKTFVKAPRMKLSRCQAWVFIQHMPRDY